MVAAGGVVAAYKPSARISRNCRSGRGHSLGSSPRGGCGRRNRGAVGQHERRPDGRRGPELGTSATFEASGGLTLASAARSPQTGVHFVAVGAMTHSAPILDFALDFCDGSGHISGNICLRRYPAPRCKFDRRIMAQRVQVILEDDFDGRRRSARCAFAFDGAEYEIDLSSREFRGLSDALAPWTRTLVEPAAAAQAGDQDRRGERGTSSTSDMRAWAQEQGYEVSSRGRVSSEIRRRTRQAHCRISRHPRAGRLRPGRTSVHPGRFRVATCCVRGFRRRAGGRRARAY